MSSGVFVIRKDGSLVEMRLNEYESEAILQDYIAKYPNLIPGDQIDAINPRKWLLISKEYGIPDKVDALDRWSIDHLFLDQDGIPTLVEVKRSSDTRIRREVVGQMLDYAANASEYWSVERIMATFENKCVESDIDPQEEWREKLGLDTSYEEYWGLVKNNLELSNLRLLFVADKIPFELRRIVEFLNIVMPKIDVLAVELPQYTGPEMRTLIPRVYGQTTKTQSRKTTRSGPKLNKKEFLESMDSNGKPFFEELFALSEKKQYIDDYGQESYSVYADIDDKVVAFVRGYRSKNSSKQSLYVLFSNLMPRISNFEETYIDYKNRFLETGMFIESGPQNLRWVIDKSVSKTKIEEIVNLIGALAEIIDASKSN